MTTQRRVDSNALLKNIFILLRRDNHTMTMIEFMKKKRAKVLLLGILILFIGGFMRYAYSTKQALSEKYRNGTSMIDSGKYQDGINILAELGDYKDCLEYIEKAKKHIAYENAIFLFDAEQYEQAIDAFSALNDFEDSKKYLEDATKALEEAQQLTIQQEEKATQYRQALEEYENGNYIQALKSFKALGDYEDSSQLSEQCKLFLKRIMRSNTLSAGIRYSAAVKQDGTVYFSGQGYSGTSYIAEWDDIISICAMGHITMGLKLDGTVVTAGTIPNYRIDTSKWEDIIAISAGQQYIVGLNKDGTLTAQGHNGDGQTDIDDWKNIIAIDAGWRHTVGLDRNGYIHITGYNSENQEKTINSKRTSGTRVVAISAGGGSRVTPGKGHTVALQDDYTVIAAGDNSRGQCNVDSWTDIIAISAGDFHTVGLKRDGTVVTTQRDEDIREEISNWRNIIAIAAGDGFTLGLQNDGTVLGVGYHTDGQRETGDWENLMSYVSTWNLIFSEDSYKLIYD